MKFTERSYGGKTFRPTPACLWEAEPSLLTTLTFWGSADQKDRQLEIHHEFFRKLQNEDLPTEAQLFKNVQAFFDEQNRTLLEESNAIELLSGYETVSFFKKDGLYYLAQVGQPHSLLIRQGFTLPLHTAHDLNLAGQLIDQINHPLPNRLVGTEETCTQISFHCLPLYKGDRVLLVGRSLVEWPDSPLAQMSFDDLGLYFAQKTENQPFWLGLIEV